MEDGRKPPIGAVPRSRPPSNAPSVLAHRVIEVMDHSRKLAIGADPRPRPQSNALPGLAHRAFQVMDDGRKPSIKAVPRSRPPVKAPPVKKQRSLPPAAEAACCPLPPATATKQAAAQILKRVPSQKSDPVVTPYGPQILFYSQPRNASSQASKRAVVQQQITNNESFRETLKLRVAMMRAKHAPSQPQSTNKAFRQESLLASGFVGHFNDVEDHRRAAAAKQRAAGDSHRLWLDKKNAKRNAKRAGNMPERW